jgi:hypothetical protein
MPTRCFDVVYFHRFDHVSVNDDHRHFVHQYRFNDFNDCHRYDRCSSCRAYSCSRIQSAK